MYTGGTLQAASRVAELGSNVSNKSGTIDGHPKRNRPDTCSICFFEKVIVET